MSRRKGWRASARDSTLLLVLAAMAVTAAPAEAQQEGREHVVRRGETLWELARIYLNNPFLWPVIFEANRSDIRNPHWIYPDQRFVIPPVLAPGQEPAVLGQTPLLGVPADAVTVAERPPQQPAELIPVDLPPTVLEAQAPRPLVRAAEYRSAPWLGDPAALRQVGHIARLADPASRNDRLVPTLRPYDRVHVGGLRATPNPGDSLLVVRIGGIVDGVGRLIEPLGMLHVDSIVAGVPVGRVVRQFGDAQVGDAVVWPDEVPELPIAVADEVAPTIGGMLVAFADRRALHGASDYGFVNIGRAHGLRIGDELIVSTPPVPPSRRQPDGIPSEDIARVRVIRVENGTATVRVLGVNTTVLAAGLNVRRVRTAS